MYTGTYFGANYLAHHFEPTPFATNILLQSFAHKYKVGDYVQYRQPHRLTKQGKIEYVAYSSEKNRGGTIKVYRINNQLVEESRIKKIIQE